MRRLMLLLAGVVGCLAGGLGLVGWFSFGGLGANEAHTLDGLGFTVVDGYGSMGVIPLDGGDVMLVDAGNDPEGKALLEALHAHGLSRERVVAILVTHGHADHVAGLRLFPDAEVYAMAEEAPYIAGEKAYVGPIPSLFGAQDHGRVTRPVSDGVHLEIGGRSIDGFRVPGHTPGSAAWWVDGVLFLGDTASADTQGRLVVAPWVFTDDQALDLESLQALSRRLADRPIRTIVTSHTGVLRGPEALRALGGG